VNRLGPTPLVCLITPGQANSENYISESKKILDTVRAAASEGVSIVQIREKDLPARLLFELVRKAVAIVGNSSTIVTVNERADIAAAAGATGVHLPEVALSPRIVRPVFEGLIIGKSVHSIAGATSAADDGADYVMFGPVFETPGKGPAVGLDGLADVCKAVSDIRLIALGGIDENNCKQAIQAGASGIAAIRSLNDPVSRRRILAALR